jgi:hypothetical protein
MQAATSALDIRPRPVRYSCVGPRRILPGGLQTPMFLKSTSMFLEMFTKRVLLGVVRCFGRAYKPPISLGLGARSGRLAGLNSQVVSATPRRGSPSRTH